MHTVRETLIVVATLAVLIFAGYLISCYVAAGDEADTILREHSSTP